jgi:uncharacterized protein
MLALRNLDRMDMMSSKIEESISATAALSATSQNHAPNLGAAPSQFLDDFGLAYAIGNCLHGSQALYDENMAAAFCRAVNDWLRSEWLANDERLYASMVLSPQSPELAAEEIDRLANDKRFVQALLPSRCELPLGRKFYWPIYKAAERHGIPIGIHAGTMSRHAPTQCGYPSHFVEDYVAQSQAFAAQLASLVSEGVFTKFPGLRVVLIESGVTWLPAMLWRFDKDWRGVHVEVPWVKGTPGAIIRDHVRFTVQPFDAPPQAPDGSRPDELLRILDHIGSDDVLLFSTGYPSWRVEDGDVLPPGISESLFKKIKFDNPLATYPRLKQSLS